MFTKSDLKPGDIIKRRNGEIEIVSVFGSDWYFRTEEGWNNFSDTKDDLTDCCGEEWDIVEVRRPLHVASINFLTGKLPLYQTNAQLMFTRSGKNYPSEFYSRPILVRFIPPRDDETFHNKRVYGIAYKKTVMCLDDGRFYFITDLIDEINEFDIEFEELHWNDYQIIVKKGE